MNKYVEFMNTTISEKITDKPRFIYELAQYYNVSVRTFKNWLNVPQLQHLLNKKGYYYTIKEVREIVDHLGEY